MKRPPPMIAGVDFSSSSPQVLAQAARLAGAGGRKLIALHVISEGRLRHWEQTMGMEATRFDGVADVRSRLRELVAENCGGIAVEMLVLIGRPYEVIRDVVREQEADLVVLGAHDISRDRLGTLAARCARALPADVLILRDWQGREVRKIVACVDFSASSAVGLGRAIDVAGIHQASLEIIHVIFPPSRDPWGRMLEQKMDDEESYDSIVRRRASARMEEFLRPFRERLGGIEWSVVFLEGESPAAAVTAHVRAEGADLTVIGSHVESWVEDFVLGSNAERLIHDSTSSVLIARARKG